MSKKNYTFRNFVQGFDPDNIKKIIFSSGFFNDEEIKIAVELAEERIALGEESGYHFIFAEVNNETVGYACFGPIPATKFSYDLYWIAVDEKERGNGLGKLLMSEIEKAISKLGGKRVYIETSGKEQYLPTRNFYYSCDCILEAELKDFYAPNDPKLIFLKELH
jgi:GNAT superfamily N-acetyltransferase